MITPRLIGFHAGLPEGHNCYAHDNLLFGTKALKIGVLGTVTYNGKYTWSRSPCAPTDLKD